MFIAIPILLLLGVYLITDPYKTIRPFSLEYFDDTNRDYLSSELFLMNYPVQQYDSYILGSSKCGGINTYHWKNYLPEGSNQFLFQAWGETITGIEQKLNYIDEQGYRINNALILIDIPDSFAKDQTPTKAMSIKHPIFSHQSRWEFECVLFYDFIQKPSQWIKAVLGYKNKTIPFVGFDPVSNDWDGSNRYRDLTVPPQKDSLKNCSQIVRQAFLKEIQKSNPEDVLVSPALINEQFKNQLEHIKTIFEKQNTQYRIVISPSFCYTNPQINEDDLRILNQVFGSDLVFDYSGYNDLTSDYNNFSDPNHFGLYVGWNVIDHIYHLEPCK